MSRRLPFEHPLNVAARANDAISAEEQSYAPVFREIGLDHADAEYMAQQRALRHVLVITGRTDELRAMQQDFEEKGEESQPQVIEMGAVEAKLVESLTLIYLDAIAIGWRARALASGVDGEGAPAIVDAIGVLDRLRTSYDTYGNVNLADCISALRTILEKETPGGET